MGIIPARAGFTKGPLVKPHTIEDHPRSRGVYSPIARHCSGVRGSSPLARGLLSPVPVLACVFGIIPARAGFTRPVPGVRLGLGDHPRSRGVYTYNCPNYVGELGSSPLARGLPDSDSQGGEHPRIIPARAGFTGTGASGRRRGRDHPRSRGVYGDLVDRLRAAGGSSPLARGLRPSSMPSRTCVGIIPARAGFTGR